MMKCKLTLEGHGIQSKTETKVTSVILVFCNHSWMFETVKIMSAITRHQIYACAMWKTNLRLPAGKEGGGTNWEIGIDIYTLLYIKQITNKNLLYSTGNSTQYSVMAYMGKESKE